MTRCRWWRLLARGRPYERFTEAALTDPNGFSGVDGIFRFRDDGSTDRGLAVLQVSATGFTVVDPAPRTLPRRRVLSDARQAFGQLRDDGVEHEAAARRRAQRLAVECIKPGLAEIRDLRRSTARRPTRSR